METSRNWIFYNDPQAMAGERVAVVVLGELVRSPRMLNHVGELSAANFDIVLIGYESRGLNLPHNVAVWPLRAITRVGDNRSKLIFLMGSAVRMGLLMFAMTRALIRSRPSRILVQNPPSFPTLIGAWAAARWCHARLVVDWHNYGYSLLALRLGGKHPFVRLAAWYEGWAGRRADEHFCVSEAMRADLATRHGIHARVLYDRPLRFEEPVPVGRDGKLIIVSPAGWTADEPMDVLLDALELLTEKGVCVHMTGDGPQRSKYEGRIAALRESGLEIHTGFLSEADYRELIRGASVGVSLHSSSSGLDLAMKNVDLLAANVPVCALDYGGGLPEQIRHGENGYLFKTPTELAEILAGLMAQAATCSARTKEGEPRPRIHATVAIE